MAPIIFLVKHLAYGLVIAWLYPVTVQKSGTGSERSAALETC